MSEKCKSNICTSTYNNITIFFLFLLLLIVGIASRYRLPLQYIFIHVFFLFLYSSFFNLFSCHFDRLPFSFFFYFVSFSEACLHDNHRQNATTHFFLYQAVASASLLLTIWSRTRHYDDSKWSIPTTESSQVIWKIGCKLYCIHFSGQTEINRTRTECQRKQMAQKNKKAR